MKIDTEESYIDAVERYSDMIIRVAYNSLLSFPDAEDAAQEVFIKLLQNGCREFSDNQHLKAWLIRVTLNQCRNMRNSLLRRGELPLEDYDAPAGYGRGEYEDLAAELAKLPPDDRNVLYLYYYEGYNIRELSEILGMKQNTANSRLTRARIKLKKYLEEEDK